MTRYVRSQMKWEHVIAECIALVLQSEDNIEKVKGMVAELTAKYPLDM